MSKLKNTSKILSLLLRHNPEKAGLTLDKNGWVNVDELLEKFSKRFYSLELEYLQEVVAEDNKQRYSFSADGTMLRANQGHSVKIDLELEVVEPPEILFHGTVEKFINAILTDGIQKGSRQYVHLSADTETATSVGNRRGKPIILKVQAQKMANQGYKFYLSENKVWLCDHIPANFLTI